MFKIITALLVSTLLSGTIHASEDFEPENCILQEGRPHIWNLCDFYREKRLNQTLEKQLPGAIQRLHRANPELFRPGICKMMRKTAQKARLNRPGFGVQSQHFKANPD